MPACPICKSTTFLDYNGRADAVCATCGSLERTRYLWLYLNHIGALGSGGRVLHVAPEKCLSERLGDAIGKGYEPVDFAPERYTTAAVAVGRFDMCADIFALPRASYDIVMHLHVLEHIPCSLERVLAATMTALKPGGRLIFAIPIGGGLTVENLWPDLTPEERIEAFGQHDHLRRFGSRDFPRFLERVMRPFSVQTEFRVDPAVLGERSLAAAAVPLARARGYSGETLFDIVRAG